VRAAATRALGYLGVEIDGGANETARHDAEISAPGSRVRTFVVTAREDVEIARQVRSVLAAP
jgi:acetate kinase